MIVCICKNITDKEIKKLVDGSTPLNPSDIKKCLRLGSDCGMCLKDSVAGKCRKILDHYQNSEYSENPENSEKLTYLENSN
ncbi:MAG: (2Fe-2S)-binding protein [Bacteriovoracaceae bacterium]|nr:(2Fe-2S)-binding protein [Bacteriovoracaceae bacterium]